MKYQSFVVLLLISSMLAGCFRKTPCRSDESTIPLTVLFVNASGDRITPPYNKVYERSTGKRVKIDFDKYALALPSVQESFPVCLMMEQDNGRKDSLSITGKINYTFEGSWCGMVVRYEGIAIVPTQTSFATSDVSYLPNSDLHHAPHVRIVLR